MFKRLKNQLGMSLVETMVAAGILGGLALLSAKIMDNVSKSNSGLQTKMDEMGVVEAVSTIINNPKSCRISLAGEGPEGSPKKPVKFKKSSVNETSKKSEGLKIALYYADQSGEKRSRKLMNGKDNPGSDDRSNQGAVSVDSLKLYMPNPVDPGKKKSLYYESSSHYDSGEIHLELSRKSGNKIKKTFLVNVHMKTDDKGNTTILGCGTKTEKYKAKFKCPKKGGSSSIGKAVLSYTTRPRSCGCSRSNCDGKTGYNPTCIYYVAINSYRCNEHGVTCERVVEGCPQVDP